MRHTIISILIIFGLTSCRTYKQTNTDINQGHSTEAQATSSEDLLRAIASLISSATTEHTESASATSVTIYDTTKPIDADTGRPPVAAIYTRRDSTRATSSTTATQQICDTTIYTKRDSTGSQSRDTISVHTTEVTRPAPTPLWDTAKFKAIIVLLLIIGAMIAYIRHNDTRKWTTK